MKLLLTGFEPFGGSKINPSEQIANTLASKKFPGIELHPAILPVDRAHAPEALLRAFADARPDAVLMLGEASRRAVISVERVAVNLLDFRIADNAGAQITDTPIVRGAPTAYFASLPVRELHDAMRAANVPVELSLSAGAFLCNLVMFTMLHHIAHTKSHAIAGFVHVPALPEQVVDKHPPVPSMALETMVVGIRTAIQTIKANLK